MQSLRWCLSTLPSTEFSQGGHKSSECDVVALMECAELDPTQDAIQSPTKCRRSTVASALCHSHWHPSISAAVLEPTLLIALAQECQWGASHVLAKLGWCRGGSGRREVGRSRSWARVRWGWAGRQACPCKGGCVGGMGLISCLA